MSSSRLIQSSSHYRSLQFGSPHEYSSQAQHAAVERKHVFVNIGYRLSVFGFLACDEPRVDGNFGFKDQWLALLWIQENIAAFGGKMGYLWEDGAQDSLRHNQVIQQTFDLPGCLLVREAIFYDCSRSIPLSGAHSIHQILYHIARLPDGQMSPIHTAILRSNAML